MSVNQAIEKFDGKAKIVSLIYKSTPNMLKGGRKVNGIYPNRFFDSEGNSLVYKVSKMNGIIGTDYERVTQNRTDNPEFKVEQLWGGKGQHINKYLVQHTLSQKIYLAFLLNSVTKSGYYWNNGKELTEDERNEMYKWLEKREEEQVVQWRTLPLDNVLEIKMDGEVFA